VGALLTQEESKQGPKKKNAVSKGKRFKQDEEKKKTFSHPNRSMGRGSYSKRASVVHFQETELFNR